jgi:hypothetical protein
VKNDRKITKEQKATSYLKAIKDQKWCQAMHEELNSLKK